MQIILQADKKEREETEALAKRKEELYRELQRKKDAIIKAREDAVKQELEALLREEEEKTAEAVHALRTRADQAAAALETEVKQQENQWVQEIVAAVLGG